MSSIRIIRTCVLEELSQQLSKKLEDKLHTEAHQNMVAEDISGTVGGLRKIAWEGLLSAPLKSAVFINFAGLLHRNEIKKSVNIGLFLSELGGIAWEKNLDGEIDPTLIENLCQDICDLSTHHNRSPIDIKNTLKGLRQLTVKKYFSAPINAKYLTYLCEAINKKEMSRHVSRTIAETIIALGIIALENGFHGNLKREVIETLCNRVIGLTEKVEAKYIADIIAGLGSLAVTKRFSSALTNKELIDNLLEKCVLDNIDSTYIIRVVRGIGKLIVTGCFKGNLSHQNFTIMVNKLLACDEKDINDKPEEFINSLYWIGILIQHKFVSASITNLNLIDKLCHTQVTSSLNNVNIVNSDADMLHGLLALRNHDGRNNTSIKLKIDELLNRLFDHLFDCNSTQKVIFCTLYRLLTLFCDNNIRLQATQIKKLEILCSRLTTLNDEDPHKVVGVISGLTQVQSVGKFSSSQFNSTIIMLSQRMLDENEALTKRVQAISWLGKAAKANRLTHILEISALTILIRDFIQYKQNKIGHIKELIVGLGNLARHHCLPMMLNLTQLLTHITKTIHQEVDYELAYNLKFLTKKYQQDSFSKTLGKRIERPKDNKNRKFIKKQRVNEQEDVSSVPKKFPLISSLVSNITSEVNEDHQRSSAERQEFIQSFNLVAKMIDGPKYEDLNIDVTANIVREKIKGLRTKVAGSKNANLKLQASIFFAECYYYAAKLNAVTWHLAKIYLQAAVQNLTQLPSEQYLDLQEKIPVLLKDANSHCKTLPIEMGRNNLSLFKKQDETSKMEESHDKHNSVEAFFNNENTPYWEEYRTAANNILTHTIYAPEEDRSLIISTKNLEMLTQLASKVPAMSGQSEAFLQLGYCYYCIAKLTNPKTTNNNEITALFNQASHYYALSKINKSRRGNNLDVQQRIENRIKEISEMSIETGASFSILRCKTRNLI